jgi:hypothetical protein
MKIYILLTVVTVGEVSYSILFFRIGVYVTYFTISENLKTYIRNIIICYTVKRITFNNLPPHKIFRYKHVSIVSAYKYATACCNIRKLKLR